MALTAIVTEAKASLPSDLCQGLPIWIAETATSDYQPCSDVLLRALEETRDVLCLVSTPSLCRSYPHIQEAAQRLSPDAREAVRIVDSGTTGIGLGLMALEAARLAEAGADGESIEHQCQEVRRQLQTLGLLASVESLDATAAPPVARRWRQRLAPGFAGIFLLQQGSVELLSTVYSRERGLARIAHQVTTRCRLAPVHAGVMYASAPGQAEELGEMLLPLVDLVEFHSVPMHSTLAQMVDPQALAVAFYTRAAWT